MVSCPGIRVASSASQLEGSEAHRDAAPASRAAGLQSAPRLRLRRRPGRFGFSMLGTSSRRPRRRRPLDVYLHQCTTATAGATASSTDSDRAVAAASWPGGMTRRGVTDETMSQVRRGGAAGQTTRTGAAQTAARAITAERRQQRCAEAAADRDQAAAAGMTAAAEAGRTRSLP